MSVDKTLLKRLCICYVLKLVGVKSVTGEVLYSLMLQCCRAKSVTGEVLYLLML